MHSTLNPKPSDDPHDFVVVPPDAVRVAPVDDELSSLLREAARHHSGPQIHTVSDSTAAPPVPPVDATFRPSAANDVLGSGSGPSIGQRVGRALAALVLAACIGAAAIGWQAFGYAGKKMIVKWTPQFILTSLSMDKWGLSAPSTRPDVEADAASAAAPQPAPPAQAAAEAVAPNAAASTDSAQLLQSMARDLASVSQEVEQLKASIAELKASQQQMSRDAVKASENKASDLNARARISALPPRPVVARPHKPASSYPPAQAYPSTQAAAPYVPQAAAPYVPRQGEPLPPAAAQLPAEPGFESVPRPPMPLR
jgi:hypothetical protein